jgi:hypothetical protein
MEMGLENSAGKSGQVDAQGLSNQGHWGHSFQETSLLLLWMRLCFHTQIMNQLNRVNGPINSYEIH